MNKILWFDLETTGVDPNKNAIIQIAAMIEHEGKIIDTFTSNMKPHYSALVDDKALSVNGITREALAGYQEPIEVYGNFRGFCQKHGTGNKSDRFIPAGYNVSFDLDFINSWHNQISGGPYEFWTFLQFQPIDVYPVLVNLWRMGVLPINNVRLETVCDLFEIPIKAHDAMSDIAATRELTERVMGPIMDHYKEYWSNRGIFLR